MGVTTTLERGVLRAAGACATCVVVDRVRQALPLLTAAWKHFVVMLDNQLIISLTNGAWEVAAHAGVRREDLQVAGVCVTFCLLTWLLAVGLDCVARAMNAVASTLLWALSVKPRAGRALLLVAMGSSALVSLDNLAHWTPRCMEAIAAIRPYGAEFLDLEAAAIRSATFLLAVAVYESALRRLA